MRRELKTAPEEIVAVVREAISVLPNRDTEVRVYLHPEDAALLRASTSGGEASLHLIDDPMLTRGGCRVENGASIVDASLENRLSSVVAHVLGGERDGDGSQGDESQGDDSRGPETPR